MLRTIVDLFSGFYDFLSALVNSRKLILKLTKQDFKAN